MKNVFKAIFRHKIISAIVILLIAAGGYFGYKKLKNKGEGIQYVLAAVTKDTLIVSVSGSGQVTALDQIDIKSESSGVISTLYLNKDQEIKEGQLLVQLDSKSAQQSIRDAEINLESAKAKLEEMLSQPDVQSLLKSENELAQAENDLERAKENYENIDTDTEQTLSEAYENGYSAVSTTFFKLSDYMKDLKDVLGSEYKAEEYVSAYKLILGSDSIFIQKLLDDYYQASRLYDKNFEFFRKTYRDDSRETIYQLIGDTLETTKAISQALESARHMFDAILNESYQRFSIASYIDSTQPKIESDVSAVYSIINTLSQIKDTIDDTVKDAPNKIKDAELVLASAKEIVEEKKLALKELKGGADSLDIKTQQNTVAQKENTLLDAEENLTKCFICAPFDGVVADVDSKIKKGDSISAGTVLATLVTKQKIAEISLNEVDVANVKVGQKATLIFDALSEVSISGKVLEVDSVGTASQGVVSYGVKIGFDTQDERVKPGMSVTADIILDVKQDVLVLPNSAIKSQGNSKYVEFVEASDDIKQKLLASVSEVTLPSLPKQQSIETGLSNDSYTEIVSGLEEGDVVVSSTIDSETNQSSQTQNTRGFQIPGMTGGRP